MQSDHVISALKAIEESYLNGAKSNILELQNNPFWSVKSQSIWTLEIMSLEGLSGVKRLTEHEEPTISALGEGYKVSISPERFGGAINVSSTTYQQEKDSTTHVNTYVMEQRNQLALDMAFYITKELHDIFNNGFDPTAEYLAPDTLPLFSAVHEWNSSDLTFSNTATAVLSDAAIDTAKRQGATMTDSTGKPMPQNYRHCFVSSDSAAAREAKRLFMLDGSRPTVYGDINIYEGAMTLVESPLVDETKWFLLDNSKMESPVYAGVNKYPTFATPQVNKDLSVTSASEMFVGFGVKNMPFNLYGSTGTV